jgi:hypothetical protein
LFIFGNQLNFCKPNPAGFPFSIPAGKKKMVPTPNQNTSGALWWAPLAAD